QTTPSEPIVEELSPADQVMIAGPNETKETSVEAIEPSDAAQVVEQATRSDSKLTNEVIAPSTTPAPIVVTEPTVEELSPAGHVMIISPNAAKETSVEAIEPSDETQIAERATRSDSKPTDEVIAPSTTPAQIIVTEPMVEEPSRTGHVMIVGP